MTALRPRPARRAGLLILALCGIVLAACSHGSLRTREAGAPASQADVREFFPLEVGATWRYTVNRLGKKATWTRSISAREGDDFVFSDFVRVRATALGVRDQDRYFLRNGIAAGESWWAQLAVDRRLQVEVKATDASVTTLAGRFDGCLVVQESQPLPDQHTLVTQITYARGVGMVKRVILVRKPGGGSMSQESAELMSYTHP